MSTRTDFEYVTPTTFGISHEGFTFEEMDEPPVDAEDDVSRNDIGYFIDIARRYPLLRAEEERELGMALWIERARLLRILRGASDRASRRAPAGDSFDEKAARPSRDRGARARRENLPAKRSTTRATLEIARDARLRPEPPHRRKPPARDLGREAVPGTRIRFRRRDSGRKRRPHARGGSIRSRVWERVFPPSLPTGFSRASAARSPKKRGRSEFR